MLLLIEDEQMADQEPLITIKTRSGKWSRTVALDDPLFSDILAPFVDLDEEVSEVVLSESLSEIIEDEWDSFEDVFRMTENRDEGGRVPLRKIARITRILNLPDRWWLNVVTDREDEGYFHHLALVAGSDFSFDPNYAAPTGDYLLEMEKYLGDNDRIKSIMRAVMRNGLIRDKIGHPLISQVDWEAMIFLIENEGLEMHPIVSNTLLTLAGRGDYLKATVDPQVRIRTYIGKFTDWSHYYTADTYQVALKSIPDDVDPKLLIDDYPGVVQEEPGLIPFPNLILNTVPWLHDVMIHASKLELTDPELVATFDKYIVGRKGLVKVLVSILLAMERDENVGDGLETLASNIEKRIELPAPIYYTDYFSSLQSRRR